MITQKRLEIHELAFPVDGYRFNVQIWQSIDNGKTWYYAGQGKYFQTIQEVLNFQHEFLNTRTA